MFTTSMDGIKLSGLIIKVDIIAAIIVPTPLEQNIKLVTKPLCSGKHFHPTYTGKKNYRNLVNWVNINRYIHSKTDSSNYPIKE
jgi:hypothetical protein